MDFTNSDGSRAGSRKFRRAKFHEGRLEIVLVHVLVLENRKAGPSISTERNEGNNADLLLNRIL